MWLQIKLVTYLSKTMAKIIAFTNQAGGVGKSTSVVNIAAFLSKKYKVLVVDADGQQTATMNLGINPYQLDYSLYHSLVQPEKYPFKKVVVQTEYGVDLLPATEDLYMIELDLASAIGREARLKKLLKVASLSYDYILMDMPPSLGLMQINGLNAADEVVIVCQSQPKSANGLGMLLSSIERVREHLNAELEIKGVLITLYEKNTRVANKTIERITSHEAVKDRIFKTFIRKNVTLAEAGHRQEIETDKGIAILGEPILFFDEEGKSNGYQDYEALTKEFIS